MPRKLIISEKGHDLVELSFIAIVVIFLAIALVVVGIEVAHPFVEKANCREFNGVLLSHYAEEGDTVFEIRDEKGNVNNDNWLVGKTDSRINLVDVVDGDPYHFKVCGIRKPLFSWSPNLITKSRLSR